MSRNEQNRRYCANTLLFLVGLIGLLGGLGRTLQIWQIGSWLPGVIYMKEVTGGFFLLHAFFGWRIKRAHGIKEATALVSILALTTLFLATGLLVLIFKFEDISPADLTGSAYPSLLTVIGFMVSAASSGSVVIMGSQRLSRFFAGITGMIGAVCLLGYALSVPALFYACNFSTAMAPNTGAAFLLLGAANWMVARLAPASMTVSARDAVRSVNIEHLSIFTGVGLGIWIGFANSFTFTPAMGQINRLFAASPLDSEWTVACILWAGALLQIVGLMLGQVSLRIWGASVGFGVFFIFLVSSIRSNPHSVAVPENGALMLAYLLLAARLTVRYEFFS